MGWWGERSYDNDAVTDFYDGYEQDSKSLSPEDAHKLFIKMLDDEFEKVDKGDRETLNSLNDIISGNVKYRNYKQIILTHRDKQLTIAQSLYLNERLSFVGIVIKNIVTHKHKMDSKYIKKAMFYLQEALLEKPAKWRDWNKRKAALLEEETLLKQALVGDQK